MNNPLLEAKSVSVVLTADQKTFPVLTDISLTIDAGQRIAIIGPSGIGQDNSDDGLCGVANAQWGANPVSRRPFTDG